MKTLIKNILYILMFSTVLFSMPSHLKINNYNEFIFKINDESLWGRCEKVRPLIPNNLRLRNRWNDYYIIAIPEDQTINKRCFLDSLNRLDGFEFIEPNYFFPTIGEIKEKIRVNDPLHQNQWSHSIINTEGAWKKTTGIEDIIIGVLDDGYDMNHPDLIDNAVPGWNFVTNTNVPWDTYGHGTHVTGLCSAVGENSAGIAGVAYGAKFCPLKTSEGVAFYTNVSRAVSALEWGQGNGVKIFNMSFGGPVNSSVLKAALDEAYNSGCLLISSAGNDNKDASSNYPAAYENVMSIGATTSSDSRWRNSNFGSTVDLYAPGERVLTTDLGGQYGNFSGTSDASPIVAGAAALIWSYWPELTNQEVWRKLVNSADTIMVDKGRVLRLNIGNAFKETSNIKKNNHIKEFNITNNKGNIKIKFTNREMKIKNYSVFNVNGKVVLASNIQKDNVIIPVNKMSKGVYLLKCAYEKSEINYKFIVK